MTNLVIFLTFLTKFCRFGGSISLHPHIHKYMGRFKKNKKSSILFFFSTHFFKFSQTYNAFSLISSIRFPTLFLKLKATQSNPFFGHTLCFEQLNPKLKVPEETQTWQSHEHSALYQLPCSMLHYVTNIFTWVQCRMHSHCGV